MEYSTALILCFTCYVCRTELDLRYGDRLKKHMQGLEHKVISSIIEVVANKKLITTDFSKGYFENIHLDNHSYLLISS